MPLTSHSTSLRNALVSAYFAAFDAGSGAGILQIGTSAMGAVLVALTLSDPSISGSPSSGVGTFAAITQGTATGSGTAAAGRFRDSSPANVVDCTVGTSGTDVTITNTTIATNDVVTSSGGTLTAPA